MLPETPLVPDLSRASLVDSVAHRHEFDELTWVASGACTLVIAGRRWRTDTETALLIPAGVEHVVIPRPDSLVFPLLFEEGLASGPAPVAVRRSPALDSCARVLLQSGLATERALAAARATLRSLVTAAVGADAEAPVLPQDERARRVATTLLEHPATPLGLEEWARTVHTSGKTLQRCFRRDTGMTFPQWRSNARLSIALQRLDRGDAVASVARGVGFGTTSAFIAAFRRRYGVTPGAYRARVSP